MSEAKKSGGLFHGLRDVAEKEFKFKQFACHNNAIHYKMQYPNAAMEKEGFCLPLACRYIADFTSNSWTGFQATKNVKGAVTDLHMRTAEQAAAVHLKYYLPNVALENYLASVADSCGLTLKEFDSTDYFLWTEDAKWPKTDGNYIVNLSGVDWKHENKEVFHAVAIILSGGHMRFFDANIGGYKVKKENLQKFCDIYCQSYFGFGWEWHKFTLYTASRK